MATGESKLWRRDQQEVLYKRQKRTTLGIPTWSPTVVLTEAGGVTLHAPGIHTLYTPTITPIWIGTYLVLVPYLVYLPYQVHRTYLAGMPGRPSIHWTPATAPIHYIRYILRR
jgi:hypothetical protein